MFQLKMFENIWLPIAIVGCIIYIVVWCLAKLTAAVKYGQNNHTVILSMDTVILILFSLIQTCYIQNCISVYKNISEYSKKYSSIVLDK